MYIYRNEWVISVVLRDTPNAFNDGIRLGVLGSLLSSVATMLGGHPVKWLNARFGLGTVLHVGAALSGVQVLLMYVSFPNSSLKILCTDSIKTYTCVGAIGMCGPLCTRCL